jgi:hypothetical protein
LPLPAPSVFRAPRSRLRGGGLRFVQPAPAASSASGPADEGAGREVVARRGLM